MFCFLLNWRKNSNYFKIAVWRNDSMKRNFRGFMFMMWWSFTKDRIFFSNPILLNKVCRWKFKIDFKLNFATLWYEGPDVIYAKDVRKYLCVTIHTLAQRQKLTRKIRTRSFAQYLPFAMMVIQFSSMKGAFQKPRLQMKIFDIYQMSVCNHIKKSKNYVWYL